MWYFIVPCTVPNGLFIYVWGDWVGYSFSLPKFYEKLNNFSIAYGSQYNSLKLHSIGFKLVFLFC